MHSDISRREFARLAALTGTAALVGLDAARSVRNAFAQDAQQSLAGLPKFDGTIVVDDASRAAVAMDSGNLFHNVPAAVLRPGSARDIVKIVRYANDHGLKIAMRGDGHSRYGQTQAGGGIVIDMRSLGAIQLRDATSIDAQPGAFWSGVTLVALAKSRTPRVVPATCMALTIGGTLSAGGIGRTSHLFGALVDNVLELDVVTGDGRLITCSPQRESELFNMVLGGMGQCGVIVRARLPLVRAHTHVMMQKLTYSDLGVYLEDQRRIASASRFDGQYGLATRAAGGQWRYAIEVARFFTPPDTPVMTPLATGLHFEHSTATRLTYQDYLYRFEAENAARLAGSTRPSPGTAVWIPASTTKEFLEDVLALPQETSGIPRNAGGEYFGLHPMNIHRFSRPLFKLPHEDQAFGVWLHRTAPTGDAAALSSLMESQRGFLAKMTELGGKRYAPFSMIMSRDEWAAHFEPDVWKRFSAAKRKYDPGHVLSPQPAMFGVRAGGA